MADGLTELSRMISRPDPLLAFKWVVAGALPFENDVFNDPYGGGSFRYSVNSSYVESIEIPFNNVGTDSIFVRSGYDIFPTFHTISGFSMNVYADSDGNSMKWIQNWKSKVKNFANGTYYLPNNYKKNVTVQLLDTTGAPIIEALLIGVWPEATTSINLDYTNTDKLTFSQTFAVDDLQITFKK